jgi:hypothetical protein
MARSLRYVLFHLPGNFILTEGGGRRLLHDVLLS